MYYISRRSTTQHLTTATIPVDVWAVGAIYAEMLMQNGPPPLFFSNGESNAAQWDAIVEKTGFPSPSFVAGIKDRRVQDKVGNMRSRNDQPVTHPQAWVIGHVRFHRVAFNDMATRETRYSDENARNLLSRMLVIDPAERISVDEALQHEYVSGWRGKLDLSTPTNTYEEKRDPDTGVEREQIDYWKRRLQAAINGYLAEKEEEKHQRQRNANSGSGGLGRLRVYIMRAASSNGSSPQS